MEIGIPFSNVVGKRKTKIKVQISSFNIVEKRKTKMDVGKRKTKMQVSIPFSYVVGKRLSLEYTHCNAPRKLENSNLIFRHKLVTTTLKKKASPIVLTLPDCCISENLEVLVCSFMQHRIRWCDSGKSMSFVSFRKM